MSLAGILSILNAYIFLYILQQQNELFLLILINIILLWIVVTGLMIMKKNK